MSSNYPPGAADDPSAPFNKEEDRTMYACQDCEWTGPEDDLEGLRHGHERVAPGESMPAGECPECGACCHELEE